MPIYEYRCLKCGRRFELRRGISQADDDIVCPHCGGRDIKRVLSMFAVGSSGGTCAPSSPT